MGCLLSESTVAIESVSVAVSNDNDELSNDTYTPSSSPSPLTEMAMSLVCHFSVETPCYIHGKCYLMLHHLAGATIQFANLVN